MKHEDYKTPGQLIDDLLAKRGWTKRILAIILEMDETAVSKIISGKRAVDADLSLILSELFDVPAKEFLELQQKYDLAKAQIVSRPDPQRSARAHLFGDLPITQMIKRGWIEADSIKDVPQVEKALTKFFNASSVEEIEILPYAAKKTQTFMPVTSSQLAWIYRVKQIASEMIVGQYTKTAVNGALSKLKNLMHATEETRKVPRILAECGIRYVIVEALPSSKIDGVCFWLDENSPVIAMSLRYDRIDNFWFVLRHELEHVLLGHGKNAIMLDVELVGEKAGSNTNIADEERVANEAAANFCVPQKRLNSFIARKAPFFRENDMLGLANVLCVHPGILAGQIQHKTERYNLFRKYQVKIRHLVIPSAMVDGWGNIAPVDA